MTEYLSEVGDFYTFTSGYLVTDENNVVLAPSWIQIQQGWPSWSYRAAHPLNARFEGTLSFAGTANIYDLNPVNTGVLSGSFDLGNSGSSSTVYAQYFGTFKDFAIFTADSSGDNYGDPALGYVVDEDINASAAGDYSTSQTWSRTRRSFYAPKSAAFAVPKISVPSIASGVTQYFDAFQLQVGVVSSGQIEYTTPRHLQVIAEPVRVNRSRQPSHRDFSHFFFIDGNCSVEHDPSNRPGDWVASSLRVTTVPGNSGILTGEDQVRPIEVTPGEAVTMSQYYMSQTDVQGDYRMVMAFFDQDNVPTLMVANPFGFGGNTHGGWSRNSMTVTVPEGSTLMLPITNYSVVPVDSSDMFWTSAVLIEEGSVLGEYFDGDTDPTSGDYMWANNQDDYASGFSYYYPDRISRNHILHDVLQDNVMLGVIVDDPKYGIETFIPGVNPPVADGYGYGEYGSGPYGGRGIN